MRKFENKRTINHDFFISESHFINYCLKVVRTNNIEMPVISIKTLEPFAWSLAHEIVFKREYISPPYSLLIKALKDPSYGVKLSYLFEEYLNELIKLRYGNITLNECSHINKYEVVYESSFSLDYSEFGYTPQMLKLVTQHQASCGVYKLYDREQNLIYIGKSYCLGNRIVTSAKAHYARYCKVMLTNTKSDANILEVYFISTEHPSQNAEGMTLDIPTIELTHKYKFSPIIKIFKEDK